MLPRNAFQPAKYSKQRIQKRVHELAAQISADYNAKHLTIVPVLTGALVFVADLIRALADNLTVRVEAVPTSAQAPGERPTPDLTLIPKESLAGAHVLIVEDVVDSGSTLKAVIDGLVERGADPGSIEAVVLFRKARDAHDPGVVVPKYVGFEDAPRGHLVGYGMDYNSWYRNFSFVSVLPDAT